MLGSVTDALSFAMVTVVKPPSSCVKSAQCFVYNPALVVELDMWSQQNEPIFSDRPREHYWYLTSFPLLPSCSAMVLRLLKAATP